MNQIICTNSSNIVILNEKNKIKKFLILFFYFLIFVSLSLSIYYIYFKYDLYITEKSSKKLLNDFSITSLYNNNNYTSVSLNEKIDLNNYSNISSYVIGIIEINKLDIVYPILSEINKDLLKISPCRFSGPNPNQIGNLCIAGHNYKNGTFFSNLSNLINGDIITIYDSSGKSIDYVVYNMYKSSANNLECTNQDTNNEKIVTLITCDFFDNHYRTIVQAKEI